MRVYYFGIYPGEHRVLETPGDLHNLQSLVGGFIEPVYFPEFTEQGIILLANEEGLLSMLPVNENLWPYFLVGNVVALSTKGEEFDSLTDEQIAFIKDWCYYPA